MGDYLDATVNSAEQFVDETGEKTRMSLDVKHNPGSFWTRLKTARRFGEPLTQAFKPIDPLFRGVKFVLDGRPDIQKGDSLAFYFGHIARAGGISAILPENYRHVTITRGGIEIYSADSPRLDMVV